MKEKSSQENEVQRALDAAFRALDVIPVSGAGVELMAAARASLRAAYHLAGGAELPDTGQKGGEG